MLGHLWARINPFQWREALQYSLSNVSFCVICGTCGCPPIPNGLVDGHKRNITALNEDDVRWLGSLQIIGGHPAPGQNAFRHPVESVFTTGTLRYDQGKVYIYGSKVDFDGVPMDVLEDSTGIYLSIDEQAFQQMVRLTLADNASLYLQVHTKCYEILGRVLLHRQGSTPSRRKIFYIEPLLLHRLMGHSIFQQKVICTPKEGIRSLGEDPILADGNMEVGDSTCNSWCHMLTISSTEGLYRSYKRSS